MRTITRNKIYNSRAEDVFRYLDDLGVTGMHMTKSSMPMMGGKLNVEFITPQHSGLGSKYRWTGNVIWMKLNFTVQVTKWINGKEKIWETVGDAKLILYSKYRMQLKLSEVAKQTYAELSITYEKPKEWYNKAICFFLGDWYGRWCLKHMLEDCEKLLSTAPSPKNITIVQK